METALLRRSIIPLLKNPKFILGAYIFFALAASTGEYLKGKEFGIFTHYNNFLIFRQSFPHLIHYIDLYKNHEPEHFDFYKYSPAFAIAMAPFTLVPDLPGLIAWNLLNALVLFFAIKSLPLKNDPAKIFILWFILQELLTNMQSSQSNGLVVALLIFGFNKFEKGNVFFAALFILLSAYIKIYGALALVLFLFYPDKLKFIFSCLLWVVMLTFIPLLFVSFDQLIFLYKSWYRIVAEDHAAQLQYGISLLGLIHTWFNTDPNKNILFLAGLTILCLPLIRINHYKELSFRINYFASVLIWLIIFNHRGESPTYIIAITGIAIWFFSSPKKIVDMYLVVFAFILTSLSPTDLFPRYLRTHFVVPYTLKALPCILIWIKITIDSLTPTLSKREGEQETKNKKLQTL